ncbi:MAG TPA: citrate transporter, partial [Candidatus Marinimicrobia bacterium]|nr:citrate transporter [Candidatus Neomarinimicrobiota bacterium]
LNILVSAMLEGGGVVMPAVILMFGIGMLLNAVIGPGVNLPQYADGWPVLTLLKPLMQAIIPQSALGYILIFALAAPLALYRGPLNVWGLGYGLAAVFLASGMAPGAVMGLLMAVGQIQGISDPTNTHNVWLANEMQQDVQKVLWNTIPYTWSVALAGLCASAILFM